MDYLRWWHEIIIDCFECAMCFMQISLVMAKSCHCKNCCSWYARMEQSMDKKELLQAFYSSSRVYTILEIVYDNQNIQSSSWWTRVPKPSFWFLKLYNPQWLQLWLPLSSFWFTLQFEFFLDCACFKFICMF